MNLFSILTSVLSFAVIVFAVRSVLNFAEAQSLKLPKRTYHGNPVLQMGSFYAFFGWGFLLFCVGGSILFFGAEMTIEDWSAWLGFMLAFPVPLSLYLILNSNIRVYFDDNEVIYYGLLGKLMKPKVFKWTEVTKVDWNSISLQLTIFVHGKKIKFHQYTSGLRQFQKKIVDQVDRSLYADAFEQQVVTMKWRKEHSK